MWHMQGTLGGIIIVCAGFIAIGLMATFLTIAYKRGTKQERKHPHHYEWPRSGHHHPT